MWGCEQSQICCFTFVFYWKAFRVIFRGDQHCLCYTKEALIKFHDESLPQPQTDKYENVIWLICFGTCTNRKKSSLRVSIAQENRENISIFTNIKKSENLWHAFDRKFHTKRWYDIWWPLVLPPFGCFFQLFLLFSSKRILLGAFCEGCHDVKGSWIIHYSTVKVLETAMSAFKLFLEFSKIQWPCQD